MSLTLNAPDVSSEYHHEWQMGATSSCINDIANDDFIPILNIEDVADEENSAACGMNHNGLPLDVKARDSLLSVPMPNTTTTSTEMKSSGSDVSISFFLDREMDDTYDENNFANVNSNSLNTPYRKKSNSNVSFKLDE